MNYVLYKLAPGSYDLELDDELIGGPPEGSHKAVRQRHMPPVTRSLGRTLHSSGHGRT